MKILDLFAGIGVASFAAETVWPEIEHEFVEINPYSQTILKKHFPNSPIHGDIKDFHPTGTVDIVWGSPPCQAASTAGKRKGTTDSRWLWPDYFRVIGEAKPRWTIAENVYGLLSLNGGLDFEEVCAGLEALGYTVRTFIIPALAVGAPHRRDRVWIVGYPNRCSLNSEEQGGISKKGGQEIGDRKSYNPAGQSGGTVKLLPGNREFDRYEQDASDTAGLRLYNKENKQKLAGKRGEELQFGQPRDFREQAKTYTNPNSKRRKRGSEEDEGRLGLSGGDGGHQRGCWKENWPEVAARTCRVDDGTPGGLHQLANGKTITSSRLRVERLKALGNSLVYPLVVKIFEAIKYADNLN